MSFRQAVARFTAEVDHALTRARRAARDARAETADFRKRTDELSRKAKTAKLQGLRRAQRTPTNPEAREEATKFRTDNGLPLPDLTAADEPVAREREAEPRVDNEDYSQHRVLFDVDSEDGEHGEDTTTAEHEPDLIDSPEPAATRPSDSEDDFSQQRILMDATVESYRPDEILTSVFEPDESENPR